MTVLGVLQEVSTQKLFAGRKCYRGGIKSEVGSRRTTMANHNATDGAIAKAPTTKRSWESREELRAAGKALYQSDVKGLAQCVNQQQIRWVPTCMLQLPRTSTFYPSRINRSASNEKARRGRQDATTIYSEIE